MGTFALAAITANTPTKSSKIFFMIGKNINKKV
jgi:hypothetical protein